MTNVHRINRKHSAAKKSLLAQLDAQRRAQREAPADYYRRRDDLRALEAAVRTREQDIAAAVSADFGRRSRHETALADGAVIVHEIRYMLRHLRSWMRPKKVPIDWQFWPARGQIEFQPVGVVGIIAPWNYPVNLALIPLASALAAGNHAMIKPSELTPRTSELLAEMLASVFPAQRVAVVTGGPDTGQAFANLRFDHLFFTGSSGVGRAVMQAAAKNLVPVTLELGGKSPTLIHASYPLQRAAERITAGKFFNAGQTCIAPDYVLLPVEKLDEFVAHTHTAITENYPGLLANADYSSIVSKEHFERLGALVDDARKKGARIVEVNPAHEVLPEEKRLFPPTLVVDVTDDMRVMQEEIFGPILPVQPVRDIDEAIGIVNDRPRPLALYYFDTDRGRIRRVLEKTVAGSVAVNDVVIQFAQSGMPFGGAGESGLGHYHGHYGFLTFSKQKPVFYQGRLAASTLLRPPYGRLAERLTRLLKH